MSGDDVEVSAEGEGGLEGVAFDAGTDRCSCRTADIGLRRTLVAGRDIAILDVDATGEKDIVNEAGRICCRDRTEWHIKT